MSIAALSALAPIVGGAMDTASQIITNRQNVKLLREQREYDSPANQVARLKAAGLNPALAGGQISSGGGQSAPQNTAPKPSDITDAVGQYLKLKKMDADIENTRLQNIGQESKNNISYDEWLRNQHLYGTPEKVGDFDKAPYFRQLEANIKNTVTGTNLKEKEIQLKDMELGFKAYREQIAKYDLELKKQAVGKGSDEQKFRDIDMQRFQKYEIIPDDSPLFQVVKMFSVHMMRKKLSEATPEIWEKIKGMLSFLPLPK